jgi:multisubunit Na+/H+ antiporter MnhC subunit
MTIFNPVSALILAAIVVGVVSLIVAAVFVIRAVVRRNRAT